MSSILSSWVVCGVLRVRACEGLPDESKSWTVEATEGEFVVVLVGRSWVGGSKG